MDYEQFKSEILRMTTIDLSLYKEQQMKRRIDALIKKHGYPGYAEYINAIKKDDHLLVEFKSHITINVSEFWRNPEQWDVLENEVLPELFRSNGKKIKIWSAACSTGDETYSLVMLMSKYVPFRDIQILATDIDNIVLEKAKIGLYNQKSISKLPMEFQQKYFTKVDDYNYRISDEIKRCVEFKHHDLLKEEYPSNVDLIVCRNVMIYFTDDAKNLMYQKFHQSMKLGGFLFVGSTEQIIRYKELGYQSFRSFFYRKN